MAFWFRNCPRCKQGRLFIRQLCNSGELYLHCEECEWTWANPSNLNNEAGQLGIDFESADAAEVEIGLKGWVAFAVHRSL